MSNGDGDTRQAIEAYPSEAREGARPQELAAVAADLHNLASLYEAKGGVETHHVYRQREWYSLAAPPFYSISRAFCLGHGDSWEAGCPGRKLSYMGGLGV
jgi:hypothetical protein